MDPSGEVWRLRREVFRHPVRRPMAWRADQATVLAHRAFSEWASGRLAESLGLPRPYRHLAAVVKLLDDICPGHGFEHFLRAVDSGRDPVAALADAGGPAAAKPLVEGAESIAAHGPEAAQLGAFGLGLPCCAGHQSMVLGRLAAAAPPDPDANGDDSTAAALVVLTAQVVLYDGALAVIRGRKMAEHPSAGRRAHLRLLPAG